jgi:predicted DNA-binding transcriptional regulator AlpA
VSVKSELDDQAGPCSRVGHASWRRLTTGVAPLMGTNCLLQRDLAAALQVSRQTVAAMLKRGELPPPTFRSRRICRWRTAELVEWAEALVAADPQYPPTHAVVLLAALERWHYI